MQCKANFEDYDSPCPHVDHCGQKEFRHIVTEFENQLDEKDFAKFHRKHMQCIKFYVKTAIIKNQKTVICMVLCGII